MKAVGKQVHEDEYHRNRTRVTEVYNLCRHIHKRGSTSSPAPSEPQLRAP